MEFSSAEASREPLSNHLHAASRSLLSLDVEHIEAALTESAIGHTLVYREQLDSTIFLARDLAEADAQSGTLVVADVQHRGRGRGARAWHAPPRTALLLTVILRQPQLPANPLHLPLVAAVAVAGAIRQTLLPLEPRLAQRVLLKWPNDVLILPATDEKPPTAKSLGASAKVAGVLAEAVFRGEVCDYALLSSGINVNQTARQMSSLPAPPAHGLTATSLRAALPGPAPPPLDRSALLIALCRELNGWLINTRAPGWADKLLTAYRAQLETLGRAVKVFGQSNQTDVMGPLLCEGMVENVNQNGSLIVKQIDGTQRTFAHGEVSLR